MYAIAVYQHYTRRLDMDHVTKIRKTFWEHGYGESMIKMDAFHESLLLCVMEKSWVLDMFGEFI